MYQTVEGTYEGITFRATIERVSDSEWEADIETKDDYTGLWILEGTATLSSEPTHDVVGEAAYGLAMAQYDRVMEERASR